LKAQQQQQQEQKQQQQQEQLDKKCQLFFEDYYHQEMFAHVKQIFIFATRQGSSLLKDWNDTKQIQSGCESAIAKVSSWHTSLKFWSQSYTL